MNYVTEFYTELSSKIFQNNILKELLDNRDRFTFYLDKKNDVIHYIVFGAQIKLIQVIFQSRAWDQKKNFDILEYGIQRKKIAKRYLMGIDEIIQFNLILYPNVSCYDIKEWSFKNQALDFPSGYYQVFIYNLYYMFHHSKSSSENLTTLFSSFL